MALAHGQPRIRFAEHFNPGDMAALAFVPKTITLTKEITGAENDDFWLAPSGVFIQQAFAYVIEALNGTTPTVSLGTDGDAEALVASTDFDISTAGNWTTNVGSTNATNPEGIFLPAGDFMRVAVVGTDVTEGKVGIFIQYYEVEDMMERGPHFER